LKRNLLVIFGVPIEIIRRVFGIRWRLPETIRHESVRHFGKTLTAAGGMLYDRFSFAPNLRKQDGSPSDAAPVHDQGWESGEWDDGSVLTFDQNNAEMFDILISEAHQVWVCDLYRRGVSADFMRRKWEDKHGHS